MKGLTTNTGTSWLGFLILVYEGVSSMPEGTPKTILTFALLSAAAVVSFSIKGSGLSEAQTTRILEKMDLEEVLKEGRREGTD